MQTIHAGQKKIPRTHRQSHAPQMKKKKSNQKEKGKQIGKKNYHANHAYRSEKKTTTPTMHKGRSLNN
jgi:hypothetical protein